MTKLVTDLEQVNVTVKVTKGTSERDYKDHLQEVKVSIKKSQIFYSNYI